MMSGKNSVSGSLNPSAFNSTNSITMQHNSHDGENEDSSSIKSGVSLKSQHSIKNIDSPKQSDSLPAWKAPSNMADVERLTQLLSHYEEANKNQQAEIDYYRGTYDRNVKKIAEQEKARLQLTKKIKQLENTMKFDKIAADGIKKKYNLLELEVREVKYSKDTAMSDLAQSRAQVSELTEQLDEDRSNRLKLMHENDRLSKLNKNLMTLQSATANDNVSVNLGLLEKIQQIETLLAINKINSDTIQGQSQEIVLLTDEVYALKQAALATSTTIMDHDAVSDELRNHITILQNEVYRLRKGLLINTASDKVAAFTNASTTARLTNIITAKVKDFPDGSGKLHDVPSRHLAPLQTPHSWSSSTGRNPREGACSPIAESTAGINSSSFFSAAERITSPDQLFDGSASSHDLALPRLSSPSLEDSASSPQRNNRSYHCVNNKTSFDSQRPYSVAIGVQQNLERAHSQQQQQQQRNTLKNREVSSSSGSGGRKSAPSISPVASLHRPHNADALKSSYAAAALDETGGHSVAASTGFIGSGVGVDESLQRSLMLDLIHHSDNHVAVHKVLNSYSRGGKRPSTVTSKTSGGNNNSNTISNNSSGSGTKVDLTQSMNDLKKCYSTNSVKNARLALSSSSTVSTAGPHSSHSFRELSPAAQYNQQSQLASMSSSAFSLNLHHKSSGDVTGDQFPVVSLNTTPAPNSKRSTNKKKSSNNTNSAKSLFVSSGLGLKHNVALDAELSSISKGSTKDMLKKILGDRDFECDP